MNDLSLEIGRGEIYGFLGPNGSGKSTTMRMLVSLLKPSSGEIYLFGQPLNKYRREILHRIGVLIERPDFYLYLSAYRNLEILASLSGVRPDPKQLMAVLEKVGLGDRCRDKVKTFSQGMRQRLGIAQAILHDPELLILDEPTNGLDPQGVADVRALLLHLNREQGKTLLISSHILPEVEKIATRVLVIHKGKALAEGPVSELLGKQNTRVRMEVSDPVAALNLISQDFPEIQVLEQEGNRFVLAMDPGSIPALNRRLVAEAIDLFSLTPTQSLEDYFLGIT